MRPRSLAPVPLAALASFLLVACGDAGGGSDYDGRPNMEVPSNGAPATPPDDGKDGEPPGTTPPAEEPPGTTDPPAQEPDFDTIPWQTGANIGLGVAYKDTGNPRANSAALVYGGYESSLKGVQGWAAALYKAELRLRGVRYLFAIQGPNTIPYSNKEIGNTKIVANLLPKIDAKTKFILLFGHSSGSYVAHEFLDQVSGGLDPQGKMNGKLVYFCLDGGRAGFDAQIAAKMRKTYWVFPKDVAKGTEGFNGGDMSTAGNDYKALGGYLPFDATSAGCNTGAAGCIHDSLVISKPHNPAGASPGRDYDDYSGGRTVTTKYLAQKGAEAGLIP